jgi:hypothetical protein
MSNQVALRQNGFALQPRNMGEAMEMAAMLAKSNMVPPSYKGKPEDTLVAMMMGSELGLNPIQALQNIAVINNRPSIYGDALLALVQNHPAFGGINETFDPSTNTATCTVWRKGGERHTQTFSQQDATTAGLWGKVGPWKQYPKRMLQMRARGFALRSQFADALAGLITREEAEDMPVERDITPAKDEPRMIDPPARIVWPDETFSPLLADKIKPKIESGERTVDDAIAWFKAKHDLTEQQINAIKECAPTQGEAA